MKNEVKILSKGFRISLLIIVWCCGLISTTSAQDSKGTDFWLMFNTNYNGIGQTLTLFITSSVNTSGTVSGATFASIPFTIIANTVTSVVVPASLATHTNDVVDSKGIHITSLQDVTVYGLNRISFTTDSYLAYPTDALGTDYIVMSYKNTNDINDINAFTAVEFGIVGTVNGTIVTITPSVTTGTHIAGVQYNIALNQGETYELFNNTPNGDLTGTIITSTQPVGVFGAHGCTYVPTGCNACDHLVEMLPPTTTWGKQFVTVPLGGGRTGGDQWKFLASQNNTTVTINGVAQSPVLNSGQFLERNLITQSIISSDKPILAAQFAKGISCSGGSTGDPFMMLIPPYEQFLSDYTLTTVSDFNTQFINIVAPNANVGTMTRNGVIIPAAAFTLIGTSGFSQATIDVRDLSTTAARSHTLAGTLPFGAFIYGFSFANSYGYAGGQSFSPIALVSSLVLTPDTITAQVNNNQCPVGNSQCLNALVKDQFNNPVAGVRVDFTIMGPHSGMAGFANTNANGIASFCYTGINTALDSIVASVGSVKDTSIFTWTCAPPNPANVGSDILICVVGSLPICSFGGSVILRTSCGNTFLWNTGATTQSITVTSAGTYTVTVDGIASTNSVTVTTVGPTITAGGPTSLCPGQSVPLTTSSAVSYSWSTDGPLTGINGASTQSISAGGITASYWVTVGGCSSAPITVTVNPSPGPFVNAGNTGVCVGGTLNLTATASSGATSYLWNGPNGFTSALQNPSISSVTSAAAGLYTTIAVSSAGCIRSAGVGTGQININIAPGPTINAGNNVTICSIESTQLNASGTNFSTVLWNPVLGLSNSNIVNPIANPTTTTTYSITATRSNGCTASSSVTVTVNGATNIPTITPAGPVTFCSGQSAVLTASIGTAYLWNTGATTQSLTVNTSGSYSVIVDGGCASAFTSVTLNALPGTFTPTSNSPLCAGSTLNLFATSVGATSYSWTGPNGFSSSAQNPSLSSVASAATGTYSVVASNGQGCTRSGSVSVTIITTPLNATPSATLPPTGVNNYVFSQAFSPASLVSIEGTGTLLGSGNQDDNNYAAVSIPFNFNYNTVNYNTVGISDNGYIKLGGTTSTNYTPLSGITSCISALGTDLYGKIAGHRLEYATTGSSPNRVFRIQWSHWGKYSSGLDEVTFQIALFETSNVVMIGYIAAPGSTSFFCQAGITGNSVTDFKNRTTTANWSASTGGSSNTASMQFSSSVKPTAGLSYIFTPPIANVCAGTTTWTLNANATGGSLPYTYFWTGAGLITNNTAIVTALPFSATTTYAVQITDNCGSVISQTVSINNPLAANAGSDQTVQVNNATLGANTPSVGIGTWTVVSGSGTFSNINNPSSSVTGLTQGLNTFRWTISNPSCPDTYDEVSIAYITCVSPVLMSPVVPPLSNDAGECGAIVNYSAATATGSPLPAITYSDASGSLFPVGITTVTVTASNTCGTVISTFDVVVNDTEAPVISCPGIIMVNNDPGTCGAAVNYSLTYADNCGAMPVLQNSIPASGSVFPVGTSTYTFVVSDASGNTDTCNFSITVNDTENPSISCPPNITATVSTSGCSSLVTYNLPSYSDNCSGATLTQTEGLQAAQHSPKEQQQILLL